MPKATVTPIPVVSVIMPVYNAKRHLRSAIDSILMQTFADLELLIIDDGSTDGSLQIAQLYTDSRVRVLEASHQGIVVALNRGLAEARGKYVARMDADDISASCRILKQVEYLDEHPNTVLVGSWARLIDSKGMPLGSCWAEPTGGRRLYIGLCSSNQFIHGSVMMRKAVALAVGGYRADFATAEDYDLWLRLGELGELANLAEPLYRLRVHNDSKTANEGSKVVGRYASRARQFALQRYLHGHDCLGFVAPGLKRMPWASSSRPQIGLGKVTLSDRAQILLWQGQLRLGLRLLGYALAYQRRNPATWLIVLPKSFSKEYIREVLRAIRRGIWLELSQAKARRIVNRVAERLNA